MMYGFIGRPPDLEAVRNDFDEFVTDLESRPSEKGCVVFGFAWGNETYEHDWLEMDLTGSELRSRVASAEDAGLGQIGTDDLCVAIAALGAQRHHCHEADIHVTAADAGHPHAEAARHEWLERGWEVYPCADA